MGINKLQKFLKTSREAIIISSPDNRRYFTGFPSTDGYLVITKKDAVFFTDSRYIEAAQQQIKDCRAQKLTSVANEIKNYFKENKIIKIYIERERVTVALSSHFKTVFAPRLVLASQRLEKEIDIIRKVKTQEEKEYILTAQKIAEDAFEHILTFIKPGVTEKQIALELDFYMLSHGAEALSFETIAVAGKKTSMPHGVPDENIVQNGDFVTMDFGAVYKGYHSDMTRTIAVGNVSDEQKKIYNIVLEAQKSALAVLKSGLPCSEADKAARSVIDNEGYGKFFGHSTGHGVGVEIHEKPTLSPKSKDIFEIGNVVTVEPGIYIPDKFGVRIEDMAIITEESYKNLTKTPKELIII